jgi:pSer/pThr/pTyr-binding forkhead associated (FHA) protein/RNA polymerase subunit RPABC4/transcription elongation factor Spt4
MEFELGVVCGSCDSYAPVGAKFCPVCSSSLLLFEPEAPKSARTLISPQAIVPKAPPMPTISSAFSSRKMTREFAKSSPTDVRVDAVDSLSAVLNESLRPRGTASRSPFPRRVVEAQDRRSARPDAREDNEVQVSRRGGDAARLSLEELMDQAKNYVCTSCSTPVPMGHKFCGRCGASVPPEILATRTQFFNNLQAPGKAKLILIRGEGSEGLSYVLSSEHHLVGRQGQLVFPDDPFVSPKHADLFYRDGKLVVRDEGSLNGVYLRVRGTLDINPGDHFLAGEQVFRVDATPKATDGPAPDGTYFYSSPKHQSPFRISQQLHGGAIGMMVCARASGVQIGREGGDLNFPMDLFMSATHCRIEEQGGKLQLTDMNSRNGTFVRVTERELVHGDYIFIGKKLLRVEITAA